MNYLNDQFLWRLGSTLGEMLKIDRVTLFNFAVSSQECVEIDLDKPLQPKVIT